MDDRKTGTVKKWIDEKGFGFIKVDGAAPGGKDLFFHITAKADMDYEPAEGDRVEFTIVEEEKRGELKTSAKNVTLASEEKVMRPDFSASSDEEDDYMAA